jgi:methionine-rich copper-binding protein CopC
MVKFVRLFAILALGLAVIGSAAEAHAVLKTHEIAGEEIVLHFNGRVDATRSRLSLVNQDGSPLRQIDCTAGDDPATLKGHLGRLAPGAYLLRWEVLSVDGHISRADQPLTIPAP